MGENATALGVEAAAMVVRIMRKKRMVRFVVVAQDYDDWLIRKGV